MWQGADKNWERNKANCTGSTWQLVHHTDGASFKEQEGSDLRTFRRERKAGEWRLRDVEMKEGKQIFCWPRQGTQDQVASPSYWSILGLRCMSGSTRFTINCRAETPVPLELNAFLNF